MPAKSNIYVSEITPAKLQQRQAELLALLQAVVEVESPSDDKAAVDRCIDLAAGRAESLGGRVRRHRQREFGDLLELRFGRAGKSTRPLMLLGHLTPSGRWVRSKGCLFGSRKAACGGQVCWI